MVYFHAQDLSKVTGGVTRGLPAFELWATFSLYDKFCLVNRVLKFLNLNATALSHPVGLYLA